MWGTDLTSVVTGEGQAAVFVAVDHGSAECLGIHASRVADRFEALEPVKQAVRRCYGAFGRGVAAGLRLRHDHGSQYVSHDFQAEIRFLGIESSAAFVREPEGNGCAERFIRTLKENLLWVRRFETVEELRLALQQFRRTYNQGWIIERHGYKTPAQVRADQSRPDAHGRVSANRCLTTVDRYTGSPPAARCRVTPAPVDDVGRRRSAEAEEAREGRHAEQHGPDQQRQRGVLEVHGPVRLHGARPRRCADGAGTRPAALAPSASQIRVNLGVSRRRVAATCASRGPRRHRPRPRR
jgi:hypothetical protein